MRKHAVVGALFLAIVAAACGRQEATTGAGQTPISVGARAPAFTLPAASGGSVSLSDFVGKPVLLYFSMGPG